MLEEIALTLSYPFSVDETTEIEQSTILSTSSNITHKS